MELWSLIFLDVTIFCLGMGMINTFLNDRGSLAVAVRPAMAVEGSISLLIVCMIICQKYAWQNRLSVNGSSRV